jgi:hypothetical protein
MAQPDALSPPPLAKLILWPSILTLAITVLRFVGELQHWSPRYFNRDAGGGAALVGIVWLIPFVAVYLAWRAAPPGGSAKDALRALGWSLLAFLGASALTFAGFMLVRDPVGQLALLTVTSWIGILVARRAAPGLWRALLAYGLAARLPVLVVMAVSIFGGLDTHYAKPRPDFPPMGPAGLFFWTALLPQLSVWIWMTVAGGLVFASLALLVLRRQPA